MPDNLENILNGITNELPPEPLVVRETNGLTPEQENTLNVIANEYEDIFASIAKVKQNFKSEELINEGSLLNLLKEVNEKTQTLLIEAREVSAAEVQGKLLELDRCIDALIEIEKKIVAAAKQYGYDASITAKQPGEVVEAPSESSVTEAVPEVSKESSSNRTSVEANENAAYISELAQMYKSGNKDIFRDPQSGNSKKLSVIFKEIQLIIAHEGLSVESDIGKTFVREIGSIRDQIHRLYQEKSLVKSKEEKFDLNQEISSQYAALAESTIIFLQTEKANGEVAAENANQESNPEESEDIDTRLSGAITEYQTLLIEAGEKVEGSVVVSRIGQILDSLIDLQDHPETDINVAKHKKNKYLKTLRREIENFKIEIAAGVTNAETVAEATEVPVEVAPVLDETVPVVEAEPLATENSIVEPESEGVLTPLQQERREARKQTMEAKEVMNHLNTQYNEALKVHYQNRTWSDKAIDGLRKFNAEGDKMPADLLALRGEFDKASENYKSVLTRQLALRDQREIGTTKLAAGGEFINKLFDQKLVINTFKEQKETVDDVKVEQEKIAAETRVGKIMGTIKEHKGKLKYIGLGMASGLGYFATGGLSGAGFGAARWAAATFGGAAAAAAVYKHGEKKVAEVTGEFEALLNNSSDLKRELSVAEKRQALRFVGTSVEQAKIRQIAKAAAVAFLVGGAVRGVSALADSVVASGTSEAFGSPSSPEEPTLADQSSSVPVSLRAQPGLSEEALKRLVDSAADDGVEVGALPITLTKITVPHYSINGDSLTYETNLSDIKLVGNFEANLLSDAQKTELNDFLKLKANDALAAHPSINESVLEAQLMEKLQGKFGNESWWNEAKLSKVDIGKMERVYFGGTATEAVPDTESLKGTYQVKSGDTLWKIVENKFAEDLKGVPAERRGEVMAKLFERIESNPELKASIGLKGVGGGDVDRIYAEQTINLDGIDKELDKLVEGDQIVESFRKSGPLPVDVDNATREIPITVAEREGIIDSFRNVVEKPIAGGVEVDLDQSNVYKEAAPAQMAEVIAKQEVIPAPRPFSASGSYFNHPDYQSYINKTFGSAKAFEQAVERAVTNFDNNTYDFFDRSLGNFESPYRFLGEKSLDELTKFEKLPNAEVRTFLAQNNMKYDTYLAWLDQVDKMKAALPTTGNTKVTDLFSRYVAETQIPKPNNLIK